MTSVNLENETLEHTKQPLMGHLLDLRRRLIWVFSTMFLSTLICYFFVSDIYNFLVTPLAEAMGPGDTNRLIYTNLTEAFFTYLKVALFSGIFITFPILLIQVWIFIAPGLYEKERKAFLPFLAATPVLFFLGAACVYYLVLPMAWPFFLSFQMSAQEAVLPIQLEARVSEYLDLIMTLIFAFGLCFQMPVFLTLLGYVGIITPDWLAKQRRYMIILIFTVAAILTPPDVLSQILLAVPLMGLYELSILMIRMVAPHSDANPENKPHNDTHAA